MAHLMRSSARHSQGGSHCSSAPPEHGQRPAQTSGKGRAATHWPSHLHWRCSSLRSRGLTPQGTGAGPPAVETRGQWGTSKDCIPQQWPKPRGHVPLPVPIGMKTLPSESPTQNTDKHVIQENTPCLLFTTLGSLWSKSE